MVSGTLSLPALGCFSPVPHGTRPLSVTQESFALEGGPPSFTPDYSGRALLRTSTRPPVVFAYRALTVSGAPFQGTSARFACRVRGSYNPAPVKRTVWAPPRSLAATEGISRAYALLISLPPGTEMFQFPGFASFRRRMTVITDGRVAPFGHPGITGCVPLPLAYRSLPRPSSPPCAQASPTCLLSLDS